MRSLILVACAVLAVGCERPEEATEAPKLTRAPLAVTLEGPTHTNVGDELTLTMTVHGKPGVTLPAADIAWNVPAGVTLLDGDEIRRPAVVGETRLVHVRIDAQPSAPFTAVASIKGDGFGATSRAHYRFGAPAPKFVQPKLFKKH